MTTATDQTESRRLAVLRRDSQADGHFVYAVLSTGIFCRPSCPSRRPRPDNLRLFDTPQEAIRAGYRPCLRCHPLDDTNPSAATVITLCRHIERSDSTPSLSELAALAGWSRHHLQRRFKALTGVTPYQYFQAIRRRRLGKALREPGSVTRAFLDAGFASGGHGYQHADRLIGMSPGSYKARGKGETLHFAIGECSLGQVLVASSERGVCAINLGDDPQQLLHELEERFANATLIPGDGPFNETVATVIGLIESPGTSPTLPLDIRGTAFQQQVWQALLAIPAGTTLSYQALAERIGKPGAARAVASACAANTLAVAIPCHRIVRNDGGLSGYRWGVERKRALLEREAH